MPTEKLYYENTCLREFTATVVSCTAVKNGFAVVLDKTAFYPEGGGQSCDMGVLGDAAVLDVQERDGEIIHTCDKALSGQVTGRIDWERRFDLMQQHSGEHLFSGLVHRRYGYSNVGFHMGADVLTVDFSGIIPQEDLPALEQQVNAWIWQNVETETLWPTEAELETLQYRSKKALTGQVRIIRFPGMDSCACCGTHVARTGEIGLIKLLSCVKFHQGVRIELVCGGRATDYLTRVFDQNREISGRLSAKPLETAAAVKRMQDEQAALKFDLTGWKTRYFEARREQLCREADNRSVCEAQKSALAGDGTMVPSGMIAPDGTVLLFEPGLSPADVQQFCLLLMEKTSRVCAVFSGSDEAGYKYAIGQADGDLRELVKAFNAQCQGRGGGKPHFAQGSAAASRAEIEQFFRTIL